MKSTSSRIDVVDVLRGFAVLGIGLIHNLEHFNFYSFPETESTLLQFFDKATWDGLFFVFAGKAFGIFALFFGFSFFIQYDKYFKEGYDFRMRYAWRLVLLFIWGNINAIFFTAEILVMLALMGFLLIFVVKMSNRALLILGVILLLQPFEIGKMIYAIANPHFVIDNSEWRYYFNYVFKYQAEGTFPEMVKANLWEGQLASLTWALAHGRYFIIVGLYIVGLLLARTNKFANTEENILFWKKTLLIGIWLFFPLYGLYNMLPDYIANTAVLAPLNLVIMSFSNLAFMSFLIGLIVVLYYKSTLHDFLFKLTPYGRMSLSMYVMQSIMGSFVYYNWGLGMHKYFGIALSLLVGILMFVIQYAFCVWWLKYHRQGSLEMIWKKLTWIGHKGFNKKLNK